jgi:hypothetical protein
MCDINNCIKSINLLLPLSQTYIVKSKYMTLPLYNAHMTLQSAHFEL